MLTGQRTFSGDSAGETLVAVAKDDPEWSKLPALPRQVGTVLRRCLVKDRKLRLQAIGEARILLDQPEERISGAEARPTRRSWFWPSVAAFLTVALMPANILHFREEPPQQQVLQYTLPPPEKDQTIAQFAISPDGHYVVMRMLGGVGPQLWVRATDSFQAQLLLGTANGVYPFWSPDSRYIGFFADGKLKKIAVTGGPPQTLCDAPAGRGGTWNQDGVILFAPTNDATTNNGGLRRVSAAGGVPVPVTKVNGGVHRNPSFLPDSAAS
jgi:hypothetical protein